MRAVRSFHSRGECLCWRHPDASKIAMPPKSLNRRQFLQRSLGAAAGLGALASIGRVHAAPPPPPGERITMGAIGLGAMGEADMAAFLHMPPVQMVALCDVDAQRARAALNTVNEYYGERTWSGRYAGCHVYHDYRELLAREDLDAVVIALPDHWHALATVHAARAGKDIYGEKPLSLTIEQGRIMSDEVRRHGCVFQTGSQQRSDRLFRFACELVRNGRIGRLHNMRVGLPTAPVGEVVQPQPVPEHFDYDFWLGPAPWAPYHERRCHWDFRWIFDYSGGQVTDWGAHHCDIAQWGKGTELTGPVKVEPVAWERPRDGLWDVFTHYRFICTYDDGVTMDVSDGYPNGVRFEGDAGWVFVTRGAIEAEPAALLDEPIGPGEIQLYQSEDHRADFLRSVRTREEPIAPIEVAHRSITIAHLGNIAMLTGRTIQWDPDAERIVGDEEAQRLCSRAMREPWRL